ncbi:hypothetical protein [Cellulomonas fengjieae]|uniref:Uncharacterized protein n=1 Tax=Cellulomonas fengjieae TaxID=2819978 RepID=A0ABS3SIU2_9CELL|nr:hypothetical protein [Cellulomonas fengjieae]MBO3085666.1 hypothetical protein [Cellulomonas fengjieae]MBO3102775.1 hypothetical protein [Cellulomonas fengjieae]QVI67619.1 hypothetical protein KG102_08725 [Cellulomonas fengjieae]
MSTTDGPVPRTEQFIVAGPPGVLRPLLDLLEADPETAVTGVTRNDQTDPERLTISIDPARAAAMRTALGTLVLIEPDEPLIL